METATQFVIALVGEKAAGKGAVAALLQGHYGARIVRFSDPIRAADILERRHSTTPDKTTVAQFTADLLENYQRDTDLALEELYAAFALEPPTGTRLQDYANHWRKEEGTDIFSIILLDVLKELPDALFVIDGMRNPGERKPLQKHYPNNHTLLAVRANDDIRAKRFLQKRKRAGDPTTRAAFTAFDERDKGKGEPPDGQQVAACLALIDKTDTIWNNTTEDDLRDAVVSWAERRIPKQFL